MLALHFDKPNAGVFLLPRPRSWPQNLYSQPHTPASVLYPSKRCLIREHTWQMNPSYYNGGFLLCIVDVLLVQVAREDFLFFIHT